ncbi:sensor histidine kinase [Dyadobacter frigoris]|uniref:histidine kinase n=1 Tax=Dyadobacter frigoris TaxID=2576211 RepID=A0A4U6D7V9_9BACT|nr:HAMP domain-containing sensor histidine kinase [Dyadobacter frigoris]TKT92846.1 HAMP domain-containing histidine kinase [Dyadobacter frigoris]
MKLFARYNRINLIVMVVLFLISGISYSLIINYVLVHELDEALDHYRLRIENYVAINGKLPAIGVTDETEVTYLPLTTAVGPDRFETRRLLDKVENKRHNYRQLTYSQQVTEKHYAITLSKPIEGTKMLTKTVALITLIMLLAVIGSTILLNMVILRRLWQPFYDSLSVMKTFKLGKKLIPDFPKTAIEEFNYMNKLLEETFINAETDYQVLKEFTENASHEIQTPLAIIRSKLDLVIQEEGLSQKQTQALQSVYSGIKRLTKLNQSLLLLAKIENHQYAEKSTVDIKEKIEEKLSQFQEFWQHNQIEWKTNIQPFMIESNPELIDILLSNLISNAGRHNREGGVIMITLQNNELIIGNTGSMEALDPKRLFRRFYKQVQHSQHNGLGLSIVKQICDQLDIAIRYSFLENRHQFTLKWN